MAQLVRALAVALALAGPAQALAQELPPVPQPPELGVHERGDSSVGVLAGGRWLYDPGLADFAKSERHDPLTSVAPLGVALSAPFTYWSKPNMAWAIELGWARNVHHFTSGATLEANAFDAVLSARWLPWPKWTVWPYFGGAAGYFWSFAAASSGSKEDSHPGGGLVAGLGAQLTGGVGFMLEVRALVAPEAGAPKGFGGVQMGGVYALAGLTFALEPEHTPGEPPGADVP